MQNKQAKIDDSRLASVPAADKTELTQAESQLNQHKQDQTAAKNAVKDAENRLKLGESELDVSKTQLKQVEQAQKLRGDEETKTAALDMARKNVDAHQAKVDYLKTLRDISKSQEDLATRQIDLAQAQVEQAKFVALNRARPDEVKAMKLTAPQFDAKVAEKQADVAKTEAKLSQQRIEARDQYSKWSSLEKQVKPENLPTIRRADVPPPPRG
jgi:hypothetical protein